MFLVGKPSEERINEFLQAQRDEPFSYEKVGASRKGDPKVAGYVVDHNRIRLGEGEETFGRAVEALRGWRMFDVGWIELCWPDAPIEVGTTVAVLGSHYGFSSLNACRIVYWSRRTKKPGASGSPMAPYRSMPRAVRSVSPSNGIATARSGTTSTLSPGRTVYWRELGNRLRGGFSGASPGTLCGR